MENRTKDRFSVINPATGREMYQVETADETVLEAAAESAKKGFRVWSGMDAVQRSRILMRAVEALRRQNDDLARTKVQDTGKPWQEAVAVDVATGADIIEFFAGEVNTGRSEKGRTVRAFSSGPAATPGKAQNFP